MGILISAFPGSGKTFATNLLMQKGLRVVDYDSNAFISSEAFPSIKHEYLARAVEAYDIVFINTDVWMRRQFLQVGLRTTIFYPAHEIKSEWLSRIFRRKTGMNGEVFTALVSDFWVQWIQEIEADSVGPYGNLIELYKLDEKTPYMDSETVLKIYEKSHIK